MANKGRKKNTITLLGPRIGEPKLNKLLQLIVKFQMFQKILSKELKVKNLEKRLTTLKKTSILNTIALKN